MNSIYNKINLLAEGYQNETAALLSAMVKIPSFSGKEGDLARFIADKMLENGFDEVRFDDLGSVIGRIGHGKKVIAFDAHIDTVYPGNIENWDFPPHCGKIENGRVWGRGTADQLGGMAAMITAGKICCDLKLNTKYTILFTGTVMEEDCDGIAWEHLIKEDKIEPELVISTEPSSLRIHRGHRGRMEIEIKVKGISCHGSAPERGENAVYKMSRLVLEIENLNKRLLSDDFLGKGSAAVTIFRSSSPSQCAVPDYAFIHLDRRLTAGETKETVLQEIKECCHRAGVADAEISIPEYNEPSYTNVSYPVEKYFPTWTLEKDSLWLEKAEIAYKEIFNKKPVVDKWTFSTNCVFIMGKHPEIKCLGFGPGDEKEAHAANESTAISDLRAAAAFYAAYIYKLNEGK